jgi:hypothetical protein
MYNFLSAEISCCTRVYPNKKKKKKKKNNNKVKSEPLQLYELAGKKFFHYAGRCSLERLNVQFPFG